MYTSLTNRMTRSLVKAFVPATLGLVLITTSFALGDGPGGSGYPSPTISTNLPADDGPGLGGGYGPTVNPNPIASDGPGGSTPYAI